MLMRLRVKLSAVLIDTLGIGMISNYNALLGAVVTLAGMGIHTSAVRNITLAYSARNEAQLAQIVLALKGLCWILGVLGILATVLFRDIFSRWTFGGHEHAWSMAYLGCVVLLSTINNAYSGMFQGTRRVCECAILIERMSGVQLGER